MPRQQKLFISALAIILIGGAVIFLVYFLYLSKIPQPEVIEVLHWKYNYGVVLQEIHQDKLIVSGFIARNNKITFTAELLPYTRIYQLIEKQTETDLELSENPDFLQGGAPLPPEIKQSSLKDIKIGQKINIFTPDQATDKGTVRVVKIEFR